MYVLSTSKDNYQIFFLLFSYKLHLLNSILKSCLWALRGISGLASEALSRVQKQLEQNSQFLQIPYKNSVIHTLPYSYILLALFDTNNWTPPTVLALGPWNFQHSLPMVWGWSAREDFLIPPPQPALGSKRCRQVRSGGPSAYFRSSFAKYKLLGIVLEVI